ncbi:MAG TPA: FAD:protein FMN transferase [Rhodothermales bacterium]|nr:FAD:protein FMN transferase [Rhodothermales bacterium]
MGVQARLVLYAPDSSAAEAAARAAFARIGDLDSIMSNYRPASELSLLSTRAYGKAVHVSDDLFAVLRRAQLLASISGGTFDVTVGPYARLWREARQMGRLPDPDALARASKTVGWRKVRLDTRARSVELTAPGMQLDLGGIAKGYAADEALKTLRRHGVRSALVEMGGDIVVGDPPPGTEGWRIEIENAPVGEQVVQLANSAISSSGDTSQYVEIGGKRYSHILDPRTGIGLTNRVAVTVIAPDGLTSDGLSTTLSVLSSERGSALVRRYFPKIRVYVRGDRTNRASVSTRPGNTAP